MAACIAAGAITLAAATQSGSPPADTRQRIIAQLRIAHTDTDGQRRAAIVQAREGLLKELAKYPHRVTRVFDVIPHVALEVSPAALEVVKKSKWVEAVANESLDKPQPERE